MNSILPYITAQEILNEYISNPSKSIDIDFIIKELNIKVKEIDLKSGILGASKVLGLNKLIIISPLLYNEGQKRFTLAHELGHILMHQGMSYCRRNDFNSALTTKEREIQANSFAAELLLPRNNIIEILRKEEITFDLISEIANIYNMSLLSVAIRLTDLTSNKIIIIYHKEAKIIWMFKSEEAQDLYINIEKLDIAKLENKKNLELKEDNSFLCLEEEEYIVFEQTKYFNKRNEYLTIIELVEK